jgi:pyrimidine operon attenuation protein / uracil phosphoribosyltransferase
VVPPVPPRQVLGADDVRRVVMRLAHDIDDSLRRDEKGPLALRPEALALVGIRTGGAHLAVRLADALASIAGRRPEVGSLDITLYRDDVLAGGNLPLLQGTDIPFPIEGRPVVLVDDVLFTGRTVRAALDALLDLGRPAVVRLAVLVDRGLRELPIAADFVGRGLETTWQERVDVHLTETGHDTDAVVLGPTEDRRSRGRP